MLDSVTAQENARCPRCGDAFRCGASDARCDCAQLTLDAATLARLHANYASQCLCGACLRALAAAAAPASRPLQIRIDDLRGAKIRALLEEHLTHMRSISPPESVHALDLDALRRPEITFWSAWSADGPRLLGCGALKELDARHGEVKSMRTSATQRRSGVARAMLTHLVAEAARRGYARLSLETGSEPPFAPARALYERFGFVYCAPFEGYAEDPNSVFMTRTLP